MKGHAILDTKDRQRSMDDLRLEMQGKLPGGGPFDFMTSLQFDDWEVTDEDDAHTKRFKMAIRRDSRYSSARGPYLAKFGTAQALRSIYEGGKQNIEGKVSRE